MRKGEDARSVVPRDTVAHHGASDRGEDEIATTETVASAGRREWIGLGVLAMPTLLLSLDISVLYLALPHLSVDLHPTSTEILWITDIYGFMIAGFLITMGTLGDRIGRRKLLLIGAAAFGIASTMAAYSTSTFMLIATRAIMGVAGATLMPSTLALINNMFRDTRQRTTAIGIWMTCFMTGMLIGPVVGGLLIDTFWWGSVFLLGVPVMLLLLVAGPMLLPEYRSPDTRRLDGLSVLLYLALIIPFIYGIKELARTGWALLPVLAVVSGIGFGVLFFVRQRTHTNPLLDLSLFKSRTVSVAITMMLVGGAINGGTYLFVTQFLQVVGDLAPLNAGLWLLAPAVMLIISSLVTPPIAQRVRPAYCLAAGMAIATVGFVVLTTVAVENGVLVTVIGFSIVYLGFGPLAVLCTDLIISAAPPEKAGSASSVSETSAELGIAVGVVVLGGAGSIVYRSEMASADIPALSPGLANEVRDQVAAAVAVAKHHLTGDEAVSLLDSARTAFTHSLNVVGGISAAAALLLALLAAFVIRNARLADGSSASPETAEAEAASEDRSRS
jgi:DHA2 family multidrug resistance protein-like MFS transporter